jgi:predicted phosphodiesterase
MKIKIISDIHTEFHRDMGIKFSSELSTEDTDVLVVAGDFGTIDTLYVSLRVLCERFPHVIFVTGNHEYYGSTREVVHRSLTKLSKRFPNFHWLRNDSIEIDGQRFVGSTLWFPNSHDAWTQEDRINDFRLIDGFSDWVYKENEKAQNYLNRSIKEDDIVITHYLPSWISVSEQYKDSSFNCYFVCDMTQTILDTKPALWIHGHTHDSCDYKVDKTRVICNPYGYNSAGGGLRNREFNKNLIVEL